MMMMMMMMMMIIMIIITIIIICHGYVRLVCRHDLLRLVCCHNWLRLVFCTKQADSNIDGLAGGLEFLYSRFHLEMSDAQVTAHFTKAAIPI